MRNRRAGRAMRMGSGMALAALALVAVVLRRAGDSATQIARTMTGS